MALRTILNQSYTGINRSSNAIDVLADSIDEWVDFTVKGNVNFHETLKETVPILLIILKILFFPNKVGMVLF
jgi:hypothetical protein